MFRTKFTFLADVLEVLIIELLDEKKTMNITYQIHLSLGILYFLGYYLYRERFFKFKYYF